MSGTGAYLDSSSYSIRAVQRVCDILDLVRRSPGGVGPPAVATVTRLPRSSVFRYLAALEQRRYAEWEPRGVQRRGYALDDGENEHGGRCVAVPMAAGNLHAAISPSAPAGRFPLDQAEQTAEALKRIVTTLAGELRCATASWGLRVTATRVVGLCQVGVQDRPVRRGPLRRGTATGAGPTGEQDLQVSWSGEPGRARGPSPLLFASLP